MVLDNISNSLFDLFVNRENIYAQQFKQKNGKKGFKIVRKNITPEIIKKHLESKDFLGVYQLDENSLVKWGCLDFDKNTLKDYQNAIKLYEYSISKGLHPLLEKSGGGDYKVHIWFFSKEKIPAGEMILFLKNLCSEVNVFPHEIFPKQDKILEGEVGNLVKLPLGLHLGTNKKSIISTPMKDFLNDRDINKKLEIHKEHKDIIDIGQNKIQEVSKIKDSKILKIYDKPSPYDDFFNSILNTDLPEGQSTNAPGKITGVNDNVLKNLAIWLKIKGYTMDRLESELKPHYNSKGWEYGGLRGWFKKVEKGDIMEISLGELKKWAETYMPEFLKLIPEKEKITPIIKTETELLTYADIKKIKLDKNYIVEDFLKPKTLTMIYSPPASFKSLITAGLSFSVANGKKWLNFKTKKCPVLYLDGENSQTIIKERLIQIHKGMNLKRNKFPFYMLNNGLLMDSKKNVNLGFMIELARIIKEKKIKVVIFDTLHRFAYYDENKSDDINMLYTKVFKPLMDEEGVSILFLHHSTKDGNYRGSGDFLGMVDVSYKIVRSGKTNKFKLINEKCRSGEISDISGEIDFGEDYIKFIRKGTDEEAEKTISKLKEVTERVKALFEAGNKYQRKEIIEEFEIKGYDFGSVKTLSRALKFLVDNLYLEKDEKGVYTLILR